MQGSASMGAVRNLEKLKYDDVCRHLNHSQFGRAANQREAGEFDARFNRLG